MPVILSAYQVQTEPKGFAVCAWPATTKAAAKKKARKLSLELAGTTYPNAFRVVACGDKDRVLCKFYRGVEYSPQQTI